MQRVPGCPRRDLSSGTAARQSSAARSQRGAEVQPAGGASAAGDVAGDGVAPAFAARGRRRVALRWRAAGQQASVYGWRGCSNRSLDAPRPPPRARRTSPPRRCAICGHHAQVVRDEQDGHASSRFCSRRSRSRICACTVTSSAVVGSSAISSAGLQASASAIITRWRMPPDIWCGYSLSAPVGGRDLARSSSMAQGLRRPRRGIEPPVRAAATSAIWSPHRVAAGSGWSSAPGRSSPPGCREMPAHARLGQLSAGPPFSPAGGRRTGPCPLTRSPRVRGRQAHQRQAGHRFAGAGLQPPARWVLLDSEAHVGDGADCPSSVSKKVRRTSRRVPAGRGVGESWGVVFDQKRT